MFPFWVQFDEFRKTYTQPVTSTTIKIQNIFIIPKCSLCPSPGDLHAPLSDPKNHVSSFSNYRFVFPIFCINGMYSMYPSLFGCFCSADCFWDLTMLLCVSTVHSFFFFFLFLHNIPLYGYTIIYVSIYLLMDIYTVSRFWLLWIRLLWIFMYKSLFKYIFPFSREYNCCLLW